MTRRAVTVGLFLAVGVTCLVEPSWGYGVALGGNGHAIASPVTSSALYQLKPRYYSADLRRFVTVDPIGLEGGLNLYVYGSDNPLAFLDPLGLCADQSFWGSYQNYMTSTPMLQSVGGYGVGMVQGVVSFPRGVVLLITHPISTIAAIPASVVQTYHQIIGPDPYQSGVAIGNLVANIDIAIAMGGGVKAVRGSPQVHAVAQPNPAGQFVVSPNGVAVRIPAGYVAEASENGAGVVYRASGSVGNAGIIRIMDSTPAYPSGYVRLYNEQGQPVNPVTLKPGSQAATHTSLGSGVGVGAWIH